MIRLLLVFLCLSGLASADTIILGIDASTSLNDGSFFAAGTTYYLAFLLTGGDASNSTALVSDLSGVSGGLPTSPGDPDLGNFTVGPDSSSSAGVFQSNGTLALSVTPASAQSIFAQQFVADTTFGFTVSLTGDYEGGIPDSFSFQLYDQNLDTLLYEQDFEVLDTGGSPVPEPSTLFLLAVPGMLLLGGAGLRGTCKIR